MIAKEPGQNGLADKGKVQIIERKNYRLFFDE